MYGFNITWILHQIFMYCKAILAIPSSNPLLLNWWTNWPINDCHVSNLNRWQFSPVLISTYIIFPLMLHKIEILLGVCQKVHFIFVDLFYKARQFCTFINQQELRKILLAKNEFQFTVYMCVCIKWVYYLSRVIFLFCYHRIYIIGWLKIQENL